ncbi:MAG: cystathionine beta-lyase, partial [Planctomycetota bacterium]
KANSPPLFQTASFASDSATESGRYDYTRSGNPTRDMFQQQVARLEGGGQSFAFTSGMAASTAVLRLCAAGEHVICGTDLYGGTYRLLDRCARRSGIEVTAVDTGNPQAIRAALRPNTRLLWVETPTNPLLEITDLRATAHSLEGHAAHLLVDNSVMSPYLQRPLDLGADLVLHSATKHLAGHGDCMAGVVTTRDVTLADELAFVQNAEGAGLAPFDCWLLLRGMKTLAVRLERQQTTALSLAEFLQQQQGIDRVFYPGLETHPGALLHAEQSSGAGSLLSFTTSNFELARRVVEQTQLFTISVSFGSTQSLISLPGHMSHASIPEHVRAARELPAELVRVSVGLEDAEDLMEDLARALS